MWGLGKMILGWLGTKQFWQYAGWALAINWMIGVVFLAYFYWHTRRLRNLDPALKSRLRAFCNAPERWNWPVFAFCS